MPYHLGNACIRLPGKGAISLPAWRLYHICGQKAEPVKSSVVYYLLVAGSIRLLNTASISSSRRIDIASNPDMTEAVAGTRYGQFKIIIFAVIAVHLKIQFIRISQFP